MLRNHVCVKYVGQINNIESRTWGEKRATVFPAGPMVVCRQAPKHSRMAGPMHLGAAIRECLSGDDWSERFEQLRRIRPKEGLEGQASRADNQRATVRM